MGKTTLAVDIICSQLMKNVHRCFAVCPTFKQQPALARLRQIPNAFPEKHIFTVVTDRVFDLLFRIMDRDRVPTLLYVDDAAAEASTNKGNKGSFARLCVAAPHLNLSIIGCFQRLTQCTPSLRDNCECLISFISTRVSDVDVLCSEFNPSPTSPVAKRVVCDVLERAWASARFCFIWREAFTGRILFHVGFNQQITFKRQ